MKNFFLVLFILTQFSLFAQVEAPKPPTAPAPPVPPDAPSMKTDKKEDTTRFTLGDKEIIIINKKDKNSKEDKMDEEDEDNDKDEADIKDDKDGKNNHKEHHKENMKPSSKSKNKIAHTGFIDLDLGLNFLQSSKDANLDLKFWSWSTTLNFLPTEIYLGSKNFKLMTSIGWRFGNYKFDKPIEFLPGDNLNYVNDSLSISLNKSSKLKVQYIQIPLMLYVQSNKIKGLGRIGFGLGGYGGVKVREKSILTYKNIDRDVETKENFGFKKYRYGVTGRIDIGKIKLFTNIDANQTWNNKEAKTVEAGLWFDF